MIVDHDGELDQDVRLVNCAGCGKELLGPAYLDTLRGLWWNLWPPLAWAMFKHRLTVRRKLRIGEVDRPFCAACVAGGFHEVIRSACLGRLSSTGPL